MVQDYADFLEELKKNPHLGTELGNRLRKVRFAITSKNKGKSGGARVITYTVIVTEIDTEILLLDIYDKSERETMNDKELQELIEKCGL